MEGHRDCYSALSRLLFRCGRFGRLIAWQATGHTITHREEVGFRQQLMDKAGFAERPLLSRAQQASRGQALAHEDTMKKSRKPETPNLFNEPENDKFKDDEIQNEEVN
jgi:hypothetical protein